MPDIDYAWNKAERNQVNLQEQVLHPLCTLKSWTHRFCSTCIHCCISALAVTPMLWNAVMYSSRTSGLVSGYASLIIPRQASRRQRESRISSSSVKGIMDDCLWPTTRNTSHSLTSFFFFSPFLNTQWGWKGLESFYHVWKPTGRAANVNYSSKFSPSIGSPKNSLSCMEMREWLNKELKR